MKMAMVRTGLVGLASAAVFLVFLLIAERGFDLGVRNDVAISWSLVFWIGFVFAVWNTADSGLDILDAVHKKRPLRVVAGGQWLFRSNTLQGLCCFFMSAVGISVILMLGPSWWVVSGLFLGGISLVISQVWNRVDRERLRRIPYTSVSTQIVRAGRHMGHEVSNNLAISIGALEIARMSEGLSPEDKLVIEDGIASLLDLGESVQELHRRIKSLDPTHRIPPPVDRGTLPGESIREKE